jgi:predicted GIY-YIG superfamily endonuclease
VIGVCEIIVFSDGRTFKGIREYAGDVVTQHETVIQCPQCNKAWIAHNVIDKDLWIPDNLEWAPYYVYVLEMPEIGHFYIGMTGEIKTRLDAHWKRRGHKWTKGKGRLKLVEIIPCDRESASIIEKEKTLEYIEQHGSDKVRETRFTFKKLDIDCS